MQHLKLPLSAFKRLRETYIPQNCFWVDEEGERQPRSARDGDREDRTLHGHVYAAVTHDPAQKSAAGKRFVSFLSLQQIHVY